MQSRLSALALALALVLGTGCATSRPPSPAAPSSTIHVEPRPGERVRAAQQGMASWYGKEQHGHLTASGERFNMYALTAAHRTLHMNTRVRVTHLHNGRQVVVRINDRGPYGRGRIIDLSYAAAQAIGMIDSGVAPVRLEVIE
jgi:rare lipoprotein A